MYPAAIKDATNTTNEAGGKAYLNSPEWQLAKLLTTGMLSNTYYVSATNTNVELFELADKVSDDFLAKALVYGRQTGYMRANPIQLLVKLQSGTLYSSEQYFLRLYSTSMICLIS